MTKYFIILFLNISIFNVNGCFIKRNECLSRKTFKSIKKEILKKYSIIKIEKKISENLFNNCEGLIILKVVYNKKSDFTLNIPLLLVGEDTYFLAFNDPKLDSSSEDRYLDYQKFLDLKKNNFSDEIEQEIKRRFLKGSTYEPIHRIELPR